MMRLVTVIPPQGTDHLLDHAFVSCGVKSRTNNFEIIYNGSNLSSQCPFILQLSLL